MQDMRNPQRTVWELKTTNGSIFSLDCRRSPAIRRVGSEPLATRKLSTQSMTWAAVTANSPAPTSRKKAVPFREYTVALRSRMAQ